MASRKPDRRVARTRALVLDAFLALMVERGYERMTVQHLLDRAGVGRATFYAHFRGKEELLAASIGRLQAGLRSHWRDGAARGPGAGEPLGFSLAFFRHVESHRRIYDLIAGRPSEVTVDRHMRGMLAELVREDLQSRPAARRSARTADVTVQYLSGALWSLMVWWLVSRARWTADELNAQFRRLALQGVDGVFGPAPHGVAAPHGPGPGRAAAPGRRRSVRAV